MYFRIDRVFSNFTFEVISRQSVLSPFSRQGVLLLCDRQSGVFYFYVCDIQAVLYFGIVRVYFYFEIDREYFFFEIDRVYFYFVIDRVYFYFWIDRA